MSAEQGIPWNKSLTLRRCWILICLYFVSLSCTVSVRRPAVVKNGVQSFICNGPVVGRFRAFRTWDSIRSNGEESDEEGEDETDDLVLPNKYYKRSKYSKVGFKDGLRKEVETQQERLARTFNIMAPIPKEELVSSQDGKPGTDPELLANIDKYLKSRIAEENKKSAKSDNDKNVENKQRKPPKLPPKPAPPPEPVVRCPNAILLDKSILFSTPLDEYIVIGKILRPHGLRGHVKVKSFCKDPEVRLCEPGYRFLKFPNRHETVMPIKIEYGRLIDGMSIYRLKLEGIDTKDQALRLNGSYLSVSIRDVPPLEEDCYYSQDLLNLDVYLFNDDTKTRLGKVLSFWHRDDLVSVPRLANLTEDLIEVEMDIKLSLQTLKALTQRSKEAAEEEKAVNTVSKPKSVSVVTDHDLETADDIIDAEEELVNSNMTGVHYVKYYVCSICKKEFTNHGVALEHERAHDAGVLPEITDVQEVPSPNEPSENKGEKVYTLDEYYEKQIKRPVRRFYIPLIKEETIKYVDIPNKSIYVEAFTVFIGEDGNKVTP